MLLTIPNALGVGLTKQCGFKTSVPISAAMQMHTLYLSHQVSVSSRQELPEATYSCVVNVHPLENKVDGG